jgi:hypothetical protein
MKYLLYLALVVSVLIAASSCSDFTDPTAPEFTNTSQTEAFTQMEPLRLPKMKKNISIETIFSVSESINGNVGGTINFFFDYQTVGGQTVSVSGVLTIPAGAFSGTKTIDIIVDNEEAIIDFYPSPTAFSIPLLLNMEYSGLELDENAYDFDFYYVDTSDNSYELLSSAGKDVDITLGKLGIVEAVIPHFSRFGWFR